MTQESDENYVSRFSLAAHSTEGQQFDVVVGWDRSMNTFFAQVWEILIPRFTPDSPVDRDEAEEPLIWLGQVPGEYVEFMSFVESLDLALVPYGIVVQLDEDVLRQVYSDWVANPPGTGMAAKPIPLQEFLQQLNQVQDL